MSQTDDRFVYLARRERDGAIKIGMSWNPAMRAAHLRHAHKSRITVLASFPGGRAREKELHYRFRAYALADEAEWFRPEPELLAFIEGARCALGRSGELLAESDTCPPVAITASEFFELGLPGCSKTDASLGTKISYSTIHDLGCNAVAFPRRSTLQKLEAWSREAGKKHGVYISPLKTLRLAIEADRKAG